MTIRRARPFSRPFWFSVLLTIALLGAFGCDTTDTPADASPPGTDAAMGIDASTPPTSDAGTPLPPSDSGTTPPPSDSGTTPSDSGTTPPADAGTTPTVDSGTTPPADAGTTPPSGSLSDILTRAMFDTMFPNQSNAACNASVYTYDALIAAAAFFPAFGTTGTLDQRKRDVAAFLANISHETTGGWATAPGGPESWGLCFREEVGCTARPSPCVATYCSISSTAYPCAAGQSYHGRGPMQLSWNYNYGQFGDSIGMDLLSNPDLLITDGTTGWRAALWFWMTPQAPKPSCHDVMTGVWTPSDPSTGRMPGFGMTINIINGGLECGSTHAGSPKVASRIAFYRRYLGPTMLNGDPGSNLTCDTMTPFGS